MSKEPQAISEEVDTLAVDARALIAATAEVGAEQVQNARRRLALALEAGKGSKGRIHEKLVEGARRADQLVRDYAYPVIGIGAGVGAVLGFLVARRGAPAEHTREERTPTSKQ